MFWIVIGVIILLLGFEDGFADAWAAMLFGVVLVLIGISNLKENKQKNTVSTKRHSGSSGGSYEGSTHGDVVDLGGGRSVYVNNPESVVDGVNWVESFNGEIYNPSIGESFTQDCNGHWSFNSNESNQ